MDNRSRRAPRRPSGCSSFGARHAGDESGDQTFDLVRWEVVAGAGIRLSEIAADHERPEPGLREQSFGRVDGMKVDDIKARHPGAWEGWLRFEEHYAMPGGESAHQFHKRVMEAVHRLVAAHRGGKLVIVTHGGVLDMIYRTARSLGLNGPRQSEIPNAGLNRVRMRDGGIDILDWADTQHLADLPPQPVYDQKALVSRPRAA